MMPSKVSVATKCWRCKLTKVTASNTQQAITARLRLISNRKPRETPSRAEWARVSPKYAMRRQTTKEPSGPAMAATPKPPNRARIRKSAMIALAAFLDHIAMDVVLMIVMMTVQGELFRALGSEQIHKGWIGADMLWMT